MADAPSKVASAITEAQSIIEAAEKRAAELVRSAEAKHKEAEESGYQAGLERGIGEVADRAVRLIEDTGILGAQLATEAARLAISISSTVVGEHVKANPSFVKELAVRALQESVINLSATVVVHPDDAKQLKSAENTLRRIAGGADIIVETDRSIAKGGCIVRTEFGEVDAQIETLLKSVMDRVSDDSAGS